MTFNRVRVALFLSLSRRRPSGTRGCRFWPWPRAAAPFTCGARRSTKTGARLRPTLRSWTTTASTWNAKTNSTWYSDFNTPNTLNTHSTQDARDGEFRIDTIEMRRTEEVKTWYPITHTVNRRAKLRFSPGRNWRVCLFAGIRRGACCNQIN